VSDENLPPPAVLLNMLWPYLAAAVFVAVCLVLLAQRFVPSVGPVVTVSVVSFDIIKFTNAQRAVASSFVRPGPDVSAANELLLDLPKRTREAILRVAGPGTLVIVKQAVVQGQTEDITDAVLTELGLPLNVPTADAAAYSLDVAPTSMFGVPPAPVREPAQAPRGPVALP
jgi:hypothetical protein